MREPDGPQTPPLALSAQRRWVCALTAVTIPRRTADPPPSLPRTESGKPFDVVVGAEGQEVFVEVKSTASQSKPSFEISLREIETARALRERYEVFRVLGAGSSTPSVAVLRGLAELLERGALQLVVTPSSGGG